MASNTQINKQQKRKENKKVKKTLKEKIAFGMINALVKIAVGGGVGLTLSVGFMWAFTHDETNVEAQDKWSEQAEELERRLEFEKAHPDMVSF